MFYENYFTSAKLFFTFFICCSLNFRPGFTQSTWYFAHPLPTGNQLNSVFFANDKTGYSAGVSGTIIKTSDGGKSWIQLSAETGTELNKIFSVSKNILLAAGNKGVILKSTNEGKTWIQKRSRTSVNLYDINFISDKTGFIAGLKGTIIKTTDAGNSWNQIFSGTNSPLYCINFLNQSTGFAGGYNTLLKTTDGGKYWLNLNITITPAAQIISIKNTGFDTVYALCNLPSGRILKSTNCGQTWNQYDMNIPFIFGGTADLVRSFIFINSTKGICVTDFGTILKTTNAGINWTGDSSFRPQYEKTGIMKNIFLLDSTDIFITGCGGSVYRSSDKGLNWGLLTGSRLDFRSVYFTNEFTGYSAGEFGTIHKTTDSGMRWEILDSETDELLNSVFFINQETGFTAGNNGVIMKTTDEGNTWSVQSSGVDNNLKYILFVNSQTGFAAGGGNNSIILKTTDGGENWFSTFTDNKTEGIEALDFLNLSTGFAVSKSGDVLYTTDCGAIWKANKVSPVSLHCISFSDTLNGFIAGDDGIIFKTTDGGMNWKYTAVGVYNKLYAIKHLNQEQIISAGENGTILYSSNSGADWINSSTFTSNTLYGICNTVLTADKISIFIAGENGTFLKSDFNEIISGKNKRISGSKYFILHQNYPNPFNPKTIIRYEIKSRCFATMKIYDISGKEIETLVNKLHDTGIYKAEFDIDKSGHEKKISSGVYFYRFMTKTSENNKYVVSEETGRMIILK